MESTTVIIPAQGRAARWQPSKRIPWIPPIPYKQLLDINGITLLERTISQLKLNNLRNIVLVTSKGMLQYISINGLTIRSFSTPRESVLETILGTRDLWTERIFVVLGDVLFSNKAIQTITKTKEAAVMFGRSGPNRVSGKEASEIFGMSFIEERAEQIIAQMSMLIRMKPDRKLWSLFKATEFFSFVQIDDYTDDIDDPEAHIKFWPRMLKAALKDDTVPNGGNLNPPQKSTY